MWSPSPWPKPKASRDALRGLERPGRAGELGEARAALGRAEQDLLDLQTGKGAYSGTEVGRAVSDLALARAALTRATWAAEHSSRWRERRAAAKESATVAAQLADTEGRWKAYVAPEVARLEAAIDAARQGIERLVGSQEREAARWGRLAERGHIIGRAAGQFADGLAVYREALDGRNATYASTVGAMSTQRPRWRRYAFGHPSERDLGPDM